MPETSEVKSFTLPSKIEEDLTLNLKDARRVRSLEFHFQGEDLEDAKAFAKTLVDLKKRGVKISHDFLIKVEFSRSVSRERMLALVRNIPKPVNGSVKARIHLNEKTKRPLKSEK